MTLRCPACGSDDLVVRDSRAHGRHNWRRRRACRPCGARFTTYELSEAEMVRYELIEMKLTTLQKMIADLHGMA
jgi:transcriptional regulator NrdR family protein